MARSNNRKVVPESRNMLNQMKYEIAAELGLGSAYGSSGGSADTEFAGELGEVGGFGGRSSYRRPFEFASKRIGWRGNDETPRSPSTAKLIVILTHHLNSKALYKNKRFPQ